MASYVPKQNHEIIPFKEPGFVFCIVQALQIIVLVHVLSWPADWLLHRDANLLYRIGGYYILAPNLVFGAFCTLEYFFIKPSKVALQGYSSKENEHLAARGVAQTKTMLKYYIVFWICLWPLAARASATESPGSWLYSFLPFIFAFLYYGSVGIQNKNYTWDDERNVNLRKAAEEHYRQRTQSGEPTATAADATGGGVGGGGVSDFEPQSQHMFDVGTADDAEVGLMGENYNLSDLVDYDDDIIIMYGPGALFNFVQVFQCIFIAFALNWPGDWYEQRENKALYRWAGYYILLPNLLFGAFVIRCYFMLDLRANIELQETEMRPREDRQPLPQVPGLPHTPQDHEKEVARNQRLLRYYIGWWVTLWGPVIKTSSAYFYSDRDWRLALLPMLLFWVILALLAARSGNWMWHQTLPPRPRVAPQPPLPQSASTILQVMIADEVPVWVGPSTAHLKADDIFVPPNPFLRTDAGAQNTGAK
jgi:hypothetical protein